MSLEQIKEALREYLPKSNSLMLTLNGNLIMATFKFNNYRIKDDYFSVYRDGERTTEIELINIINVSYKTGLITLEARI